MSALDDPEMQEIFEGFLVETQELLDSVTQDLMILEDSPGDDDLLNRIFRSFHTIKGTSSFMGFTSIADITHHAEDILNKLRRYELDVSRPLVDVLLEVHDIIEVLVEQLQSGEESDYDYSETINKINMLKDPDNVSAGQSGAITQPSASASEDENKKSALDSVLGDPELAAKPGDFTDEELELLDAAFNEVNSAFFNEQESVSISMEDFENQVKSKSKKEEETEKAVSESNLQTEDIAKTEETAEKKIEEPKKAAPPKASMPDHKKNGKRPSKSNILNESIRIDVNRVETLMDLSGELVLGRNRLSQLTEVIESEFDKVKSVTDLIETAAQIDFVTSEIQSAVMRMRMVPVGKLYQKAPRIVRDLSKEFNKKIKLVVKGEETEIDRGIIEELNDPLVHMIRNSCDHGITTPAERIAQNKPEEGTITLDAEQEGNAIVLKISDDGNGMDPEKLKQKALEKEIISEEQAAQMSKREALQLIFMPGFSTAQKVSSVSGRGVGMDVVRTNIQNLKGMIDIESEMGEGTTFIIKLPLTLAIIQGLLVRLSNETYAIPLSAVVEVVAADLEKIKTVNMQEVIRLRDDVYPLLRLDNILGVEDAKTSLEDRYVVVVGLGLQRIGFVVDELLGQQEIVIKSLGEYLGNVSGVAGSTILGDGRVIMIIDVAELVNSAYADERLAGF